MKTRQPLVFAILTDICNQLEPEARITLEEFTDLLKANMGNRDTEERLRMIFYLWDEDFSEYIDLFNVVAVAEDIGCPITNQQGKEIIKNISATDKVSF